jgi:ubiquitin conjugation factor E4 B
MMTKAVAGLSYQLSNMSMNDNFKVYIDALKTLIHFPKILNAIADDPLFYISDLQAPLIEKSTLLGPFFRISPLQPEVTKEFFSSPKTMDKRQINQSQDALRLTLQTHQHDLLEITNRFIKDKEGKARNKMLDWFAHIVNSNHKRRAIQVDPKTVSSDGFMMNITVILDGLCEPFMDTTFSKVSRIDIKYLRREPRVDIKDETKLNADQNASDQFYSTKADGSNNFISEVFFLTLAAHHYGSEATNAKLKTLDREIKHFTSRLEEMEAERHKFVNHPSKFAIDSLCHSFTKVLTTILDNIDSL